MEPGKESNYHPEKPIQYDDIIAYVQEKHGVKIHSEYIAGVKRLCGIPVRGNRNQSKKGNPHRKPHCPADKVAYIKEALEHFGLLPQKNAG